MMTSFHHLYTLYAMRIVDTTQRTIHTLRRTDMGAYTHTYCICVSHINISLYTRITFYTTLHTILRIQLSRIPSENVLIFLRYALNAYVYLFFCVLSNILILLLL